MESRTTIIGPTTSKKLSKAIDRDLAGWERAADLGEFRLINTSIRTEVSGDDWFSTITVTFAPLTEEVPAW